MQDVQVTEDTLWSEAVAFTRDKSPGSFEQWFSGVQFDGITDGVLCLRARDEFVRDWVEDYFMPHMSIGLRERTGWSIQVAWSIGGPIDRARPTAVLQPPALRVAARS